LSFHPYRHGPWAIPANIPEQIKGLAELREHFNTILFKILREFVPLLSSHGIILIYVVKTRLIIMW